MENQKISILGKTPELASDVFIAPGARIVGDVKIGRRSSVFYNAVIRADIASVRIGDRTNIQDNATIHLSSGIDTEIGDDVTVGHNAVLHSCIVESGSTIGMGAIIMDGAKIRKDSIVGAGTLVPAGKEFPERALILGMPARFVRELSEEEIWEAHENTARYVRLIAEAYV